MAEGIQTVQLVRILPTAIWIEDDICGGRHVMLQHEGMEPFCCASFHYSYAYTSNSGTHAEAHRLAVGLGGVEPIEHRMQSMQEAPKRALPAYAYDRWCSDSTKRMASPVLVSARAAIEQRYTGQGATAPKGASNPYRKGSAAATWWARGNAGVQEVPRGVKVGTIGHVAPPGFGPATDLARAAGVALPDGAQK